MRFFTTLILCACLAVSACAINPVTGKSDFAVVSESAEIEQGRKYHREIIKSYGVYDDPALQQYVNRLGQELAAKSHRAHLSFTFTVLDSPEINAFALPGGYIYITRGIMAYLDSEAELAGVLGHEIGHVTARHSVRQQSGQMASDLLSVLITATTGEQALGSLSQQLSTGIIRGYGREHELEADKLGAQYLHSTGYNPETMLEVIGVLKDQEVYEKALADREGRPANIYHGVYSTHPRNDDRLKTVIRAAKKLPTQSYRDDNQPTYHGFIDGMAWGPSISQGVVVRNRLSHPGLAMELQLPKGWKVNNNPEYLQAHNPSSGALVQISVVERNQNEKLEVLLKRITGNDKLEVAKPSYGVTASANAKPANGESQPARISAIELKDKQVLILFGTATRKHFAKTDAQLKAINKSFRRLNAKEVAAIKAPRLKIIERKSQSFDSLAEQSAIDYEAVSILRLLNRSFPKGNIANVDKLKVIVFDD